MEIRVAVTNSHKPDFVSQTIMDKLGVPVSHSIIIYKDAKEEDRVYHATGDGVHDKTLADFLEHKNIYKEVTIDLKVSKDYFLGYVDGSRGKGYGHGQFVGFLLPALQEAFDNNEKEIICSELTAIIVNNMSEYNIGNDEDYVSPKDILDFIELVQRIRSPNG